MTRPSAVPATVLSRVASGATVRMSREPAMTRENTSRPSWSVPNQCSAEGGASALSMIVGEGVVGDQMPRRTARRRPRTATMPRPVRNVPDRISEP